MQEFDFLEFVRRTERLTTAKQEKAKRLLVQTIHYSLMELQQEIVQVIIDMSGINIIDLDEPVTESNKKGVCIYD